MLSDGLPDSIQGEQPEKRLCDAFAESAGRTMANLKSLIDPKFNQDDVTILLAKRIAGSSSGLSAWNRRYRKRERSGADNARLVRQPLPCRITEGLPVNSGGIAAKWRGAFPHSVTRVTKEEWRTN